MMQAAMLITQVSDTHVKAEGELLYGRGFRG